MSLHRITIVALVAAAGIGGALACGPDFPWQLLDDRSATLLDAPAGLSFIVPAQGSRGAAARHARGRRASTDADDRKLEPLKVEEDEAASGVWRALVERPLSQKDYSAQAERRAPRADGRAGARGR